MNYSISSAPGATAPSTKLSGFATSAIETPTKDSLWKRGFGGPRGGNKSAKTTDGLTTSTTQTATGTSAQASETASSVSEAIKRGATSLHDAFVRESSCQKASGYKNDTTAYLGMSESEPARVGSLANLTDTLISAAADPNCEDQSWLSEDFNSDLRQVGEGLRNGTDGVLSYVDGVVHEGYNVAGPTSSKGPRFLSKSMLGMSTIGLLAVAGQALA